MDTIKSLMDALIVTGIFLPFVILIHIKISPKENCGDKLSTWSNKTD
ncbi:hypothetical protein C21_03768 [Arenibacter sp. NBRC 103722]|nr:hypothetical protein C21_03768 [Arenibacter sp. NBRC 103722]